MATVKEIAEKTGYSKATISRVLSNDPSFTVSGEAREKIQVCAENLHYVYKNRKAVLEKSSFTQHKVGIIPIGLESTDRGELQDPYYLYIRNGVEARLDEIGIHTARVISMNKAEDYEKLEGMDSIIVIGKRNFEVQNPYFQKLKNVIFVDYDFDSCKYDCVLSNFSDAVDAAMNYLMDRGYRNIGYIGSWDYVNDFSSEKMIRRMDTRQIAFENYARSKELNFRHFMYIGDKFTKAVGYELAKQAILTGNLPEVFLIGSDPMALGVYRAFGEAGIRIGKDIGLVSIDGIEDTAYMSPPLTTVMVYAYQMGRSAVDCLTQRIEGRPIPVKVILPVQLMERESCKKEV
ncbi:MAG: LacI family DNA-binding transcriptional regulator [Anaerocolumna sp.]